MRINPGLCLCLFENAHHFTYASKSKILTFILPAGHAMRQEEVHGAWLGSSQFSRLKAINIRRRRWQRKVVTTFSLWISAAGAKSGPTLEETKLCAF